MFIVEQEWDVYKFFVEEESVTIEGSSVMIKKFKHQKTRVGVEVEVTRLQALKLKRQEQYNTSIARIDGDIAKQNQYLLLMA